MERVSRAFYKVSIILSIVCIVVCALGMIGFAIGMGALLTSGKLPYNDPQTSQQITAGFVIAMLAIYESVMFILLLLLIAELVVCKLALAKNNKGLHIAAIVLGAMTTGFSIAAGVLGIIALNRKQ